MTYYPYSYLATSSFHCMLADLPINTQISVSSCLKPKMDVVLVHTPQGPTYIPMNPTPFSSTRSSTLSDENSFVKTNNKITGEGGGGCVLHTINNNLINHTCPSSSPYNTKRTFCEMPNTNTNFYMQNFGEIEEVKQGKKHKVHEGREGNQCVSIKETRLNSKEFSMENVFM